jgi:AraC family transcriptional regulator
MDVQANSQVDAFGEAVARRFRTDKAETFFAKTVSKDPIAISRVVLAVPTGRWTEPLDLEAAFAVHVMMAPLPRAQTFIERRHTKLDPLGAGDICLFDLSTSQITLFQDPVDTVRIHLSQRVLDDLAYDRGQRPVSGLRPTFGAHDEVLHSLAAALLRRGQIYGNDDPLFMDHVALAFHAHIAGAYGQLGEARPLRGGLAPWQFRRARDLMTARLSDGVSIAELAQACALSASYFARAFRRSAGIPAHKWLMNERVERAKGLLLDSALSLPEIALACGFTDQSHLTRVFLLREGQPPARWRRLRQG